MPILISNTADFIQTLYENPFSSLVTDSLLNLGYFFHIYIDQNHSITALAIFLGLLSWKQILHPSLNRLSFMIHSSSLTSWIALDLTMDVVFQ